MITSSSPPASLVDELSTVQLGVFDAPVRNVNLEDALIRSGGKRRSLRFSRLRLKEWQHFGISLPELFLSFAIVDAKFLRTTWCSVVDRETGRHFEHARQSPLLRMRIAKGLFSDRTFVRAGKYEIHVENTLADGLHRVHIRIGESGSKPEVRASLRCLHDLSEIQPLVVVLPVGRGRGMYSHKVALPVEGTIRVGDRVCTASRETAFAILDIHKAHYPRHTFWNWATCAGHDGQSRAVALNLTRNVNEDDEKLNENAVWVDGRITHLGPARFEFDKRSILEPWKLWTTDGLVDLVFTPQGERTENIQLGLVSSKFHQPYGTFRGTVKIGDEEIEIEDSFGVCEDHEAVW